MRLTTKAFAREVNLPAVKAKCVDKILVPACELCCDVFLVLGSERSSREPCIGTMFHPQDICQINPCPRVFHRSEGPRLPKEGSVFLEQALEGRTPLVSNLACELSCEMEIHEQTLNQMTISSDPAGFSVGKNQNHRALPFGWLASMGISPA